MRGVLKRLVILRINSRRLKAMYFLSISRKRHGLMRFSLFLFLSFDLSLSLSKPSVLA